MIRAQIRAQQFRAPASQNENCQPQELSPAKRLPAIVPPRLLWGAAIVAGVLLFLGGAGFASILRTNTEPEPVVGIPQQRVGSNYVLLRDYSDRMWLSFALRNVDWLGEPLWPERPFDIWPSCVGFTNYIVCHNPDIAVRGTSWEFLPMLLGSTNLPAGQLPDPRAELAPVIQNYFSGLAAAGVDVWYRFGAVQSPPYCPPNQGECFQVFQMQVLRWPRDGMDPSEVRVSPLGQQTRIG